MTETRERAGRNRELQQPTNQKQPHRTQRQAQQPAQALRPTLAARHRRTGESHPDPDHQAQRQQTDDRRQNCHHNAERRRQQTQRDAYQPEQQSLPGTTRLPIRPLRLIPRRLRPLLPATNPEGHSATAVMPLQWRFARPAFRPAAMPAVRPAVGLVARHATHGMGIDQSLRVPKPPHRQRTNAPVPWS